MDISISDMMEIQRKLQKKYEGIWEGVQPKTAKNHLLYAVEEIGEVSAILKKRGAEAVVQDAELRAHFCEEMSDVMMYLSDVLLCCGITADEMADAYWKKANVNLQRDFEKEHQQYLKEKTE